LSDYIKAVGIDSGLRKTGVALFAVHPEEDVLLEADTLVHSKGAASEQMRNDVMACWSMYTNLENFLIKHKPQALFIEMPHGGGKSARAHRCMGMTTAVIASLVKISTIEHELFTPTDVEKALGIYVTNNQARELGIPKGQTGKYKKARLKDIVLGEFRDFDGWPKAAFKAEDAYDAAAAFLAARERGSDLYMKLRRKVSGGQAG